MFQIKGNTYGKNGENLDWDLWDRWTVTNTVQTVQVFRDGFGSAGKRLDQSNMIGDGRMAKGSAIMVRKIIPIWTGVDIKTNAELNEFYQYMATTVFQLKINGKDIIFQQKLNRLFGIAIGMVHLPTVAGDSVQPFNVKALNNEFPVNIPIALDENVEFWGEIVPGVGASAGQVGDFFDIGLNGEFGRLS